MAKNEKDKQVTWLQIKKVSRELIISYKNKFNYIGKKYVWTFHHQNPQISRRSGSSTFDIMKEKPSE